MKRLLVIFLAVAVLFSLSSCAKKSEMYYDYTISDMLKVEDCSFEVSRNSTYFREAYQGFYDDIFGEDLLEEVDEGVVEYGDVVNIDYVGSFDGVPFDGGTDSNYDLEIGSESFIEGFEDGLVGEKIGEKVSLNLKFPEDDHRAEYAGRDCVFEVKINYAKKFLPPNEKNIGRYGFKSLADYEKQAEIESAAKALFMNMLKGTTVSQYPEKEAQALYENTIKYYQDYCAKNNITFDYFVSANGFTQETFKEYLTEYEIKNSMKNFMLSYYILEENDTVLTEEDIEKKKQELIKEHGENLEKVNYYQINIEQEAAYDKAIELLKTKVKIID